VRRFVRRFRRQREAYQRGEIALEEMTTSVQSWIAHAAHGDTWRLRGRLFEHAARRVDEIGRLIGGWKRKLCHLYYTVTG